MTDLDLRQAEAEVLACDPTDKMEILQRWKYAIKQWIAWEGQTRWERERIGRWKAYALMLVFLLLCSLVANVVMLRWLSGAGCTPAPGL